MNLFSRRLLEEWEDKENLTLDTSGKIMDISKNVYKLGVLKSALHLYNYMHFIKDFPEFIKNTIPTIKYLNFPYNIIECIKIIIFLIFTVISFPIMPIITAKVFYSEALKEYKALKFAVGLRE